MLYSRDMFKTKNKKESRNKMKKYEVKFNSQEIVVNDNSQSMFKSIDYMNKNYITKSKKNAFVMNMIAKSFEDCLSKARQVLKNASSIEVKEIKQATSSIDLSNNNKKVA